MSALIEISLNQALNLASNRQALLAPLQGNVCFIHLIELDRIFAFHFSTDKVDVTHQQGFSDEALEALGDHECYVSIAMSALPDLQKTSQLTKLIKQGKLDFYGDLRVLQKLSSLFSLINIDIEEILSGYIGDAPTHWLMSTGEQLHKALKHSVGRQATALADFMFDERPVAVRAIMVENFLDEVKRINADVARFEARIQRLEKVKGL